MDVDIDFPTNFDPLKYFTEAVRASIVKDNKLTKHPAGVYFQPIPKDKLTLLSAIPYESAEELGYFKIDFLHLSTLDNFNSKDEIRQLLKTNPDWNLLTDRETVSKLFQIHNHFDVIYRIKPTSVQELADCIALIRPGKRYLLDKYTTNKQAIRKELYKKPADESKYYFKRGHALAYAHTIVLELHLIKNGKL